MSNLCRCTYAQNDRSAPKPPRSPLTLLRVMQCLSYVRCRYAACDGDTRGEMEGEGRAGEGHKGKGGEKDGEQDNKRGRHSIHSISVPSSFTTPPRSTSPHSSGVKHSHLPLPLLSLSVQRGRKMARGDAEGGTELSTFKTNIFLQSKSARFPPSLPPSLSPLSLPLLSYVDISTLYIRTLCLKTLCRLSHAIPHKMRLANAHTTIPLSPLLFSHRDRLWQMM